MDNPLNNEVGFAISEPNPITWIDVARRLATLEPTSSAWMNKPAGLLRAQVDWTGALFELMGGKSDEEEVVAWLTELFPQRIMRGSDGTKHIRLDGPPHAELLQIEFETRTEPASAGKIFLGSIEPAVDFMPLSARPSKGPVPLIACHSVKGGTGRTTIAVAIARHWYQRTRNPILLVDADVEAPGISYLFRDVRKDARIGLEDLIALAHADLSVGYRSTLEYVASKLTDHRVDGVVVLPLRRDLDELATSSLRAEHLSNAETPFALAQLLSELAAACGCSGVVVDLRAGLVPVSLQFALDPNVARVITTSLSGQSLEATAALMRFIARELRRQNAAFPKPLLVVNRVPTVLRDTGADESLLRPILDRMTNDVLRGHQGEVGADQALLDDEVEVSPWSLIKISEISDLQVSFGGWTRFTDQIHASGFSSQLSPELDSWLGQEVGAGIEVLPIGDGVPTGEISNRKRRRLKLKDFANRFVAAETADQPVDTPLITGPLLALAENFSSQLPIIVSEGAKGTGKTLTARFLVSKSSWDAAVFSLAGEHPAVDAPIVPVLGSIQTSEKFQSEIDDQRARVAELFGMGKPQRVDQTKLALLTKLADADANERVSIWLDAIAWSLGVGVGRIGAGKQLLRVLNETNRRVLAVFEGIEELYSDPYAADSPQILRSLLVDLPARLRGEPGRPLGVVVFARRDTVDAAVQQNRTQFRISYKDFALSWSDDDVLELAAWLATKAESLVLWDETFQRLPQVDKERRLEPLWGRKLGPDDKPGRRTAEAYTAAWVLALLSDLQGRLVARDLVRFLANAADYTPTPSEDEQYGSRLLVPRAVRQAIKPTSVSKVKETEEEVRELKAVFAKFLRKKNDIRAPIDEAAIRMLKLSQRDISLLKRHGILFGEAAPYEVPELFRMGLNLKHSGARHSVINLRRKSRQSLGLQT